MTIIQKILATLGTVIRQYRCEHEFQRDEFTTDSALTKSCRKCHKRVKTVNGV